MRKLFRVDIKTKGTNYFDTETEALDYALIVAGFQGLRYKITEVLVNEPLAQPEPIL